MKYDALRDNTLRRAEDVLDGGLSGSTSKAMLTEIITEAMDKAYQLGTEDRHNDA